MTGEELFNVWRPMGGKYWGELDDFEQARWNKVGAKAGEVVKQNYEDGWNDGSDEAWAEAEAEYT